MPLPSVGSCVSIYGVPMKVEGHKSDGYEKVVIVSDANGVQHAYPYGEAFVHTVRKGVRVQYNGIPYSVVGSDSSSVELTPVNLTISLDEFRSLKEVPHRPCSF